MTAKELALHNVADTGYQLEMVFKGLSDADWDFKVNDTAMSPRELAAHLSDCYLAYDRSQRGEPHEWGSFQSKATDGPSAYAEMLAHRATAVKWLDDAATDKALKESSAYIALHDAYHVGQMCLTRLKLDPAWDGYSIYKMD